jgi:hypothetical protein
MLQKIAIQLAAFAPARLVAAIARACEVTRRLRAATSPLSRNIWQAVASVRVMNLTRRLIRATAVLGRIFVHFLHI